MKSEFRKKLKPVGVMLINIEHSRNADCASRGFIFGQGFSVKKQAAFFVNEVLSVFAFNAFKSKIATVAAYVFLPACKAVQG